MRYELSDYEWAAIKPMLPNKPRGVPRVNDRHVLNGIFWVLRSGAPWRDLLETYGPRTTCYNRFVRWRRAGGWDQIIDAQAAGHDTAVQMIILPSCARAGTEPASRTTIIKIWVAHEGSKIHAVVDTNGLPVQLALTPGEAHDNRLCSVLLSSLLPQTMLLADRGYDADWIRELARQQGAWANISAETKSKTRSASARICIVREISSNGSSTRSAMSACRHPIRQTLSQLSGVHQARINPHLAAR